MPWKPYNTFLCSSLPPIHSNFDQPWWREDHIYHLFFQKEYFFVIDKPWWLLSLLESKRVYLSKDKVIVVGTSEKILKETPRFFLSSGLTMVVYSFCFVMIIVVILNLIQRKKEGMKKDVIRWLFWFQIVRETAKFDIQNVTQSQY